MNIAITESTKGGEVIHGHVKTDIGTGERGSEITASDADDLTVRFDAEELNPDDVVFDGIRVRDFLPHRHTNDIDALFPSLINLDYRDMFFLALGFRAFQNVAKLHVYSLYESKSSR